MARFIKLLAINSDAKSFLRLSSKAEIICKGLGRWAMFSSMSVRVKENKATSAPEIKAEHSNNKNSNTNPGATEKSTTKNIVSKLEGSGSNSFSVSYS